MEKTLGAYELDEKRTQFCVWAPYAQKLEVQLLGPTEKGVPLEREENGYYRGIVEGAAPGSLYRYRLDGLQAYPDPASRFQPQGVHGPSEAVSSHFPWEDRDWKGLNLSDYILYELHVGTFTPEGTFDAVAARLDTFKELGVNAIELMPVGQFPGSRNWGYDGVYPFAAHASYGGPQGLRRLVNACHQADLAVLLDVVYNHLGPEGNYLGHFGPYFTDKYHTPWGPAINFDGSGSEEVRHFFIENALYWLREFHIDALRVDAIHGIFDMSAKPFLEILGEKVREDASRRGRKNFLILESDLNDARFVRPKERGGLGLDAQWNDDFHHAVHTLLTGERRGYYQDFGKMEHLAKAFREGFVYSGQRSSFRDRNHGNSSQDIQADQLVVFIQNHDQVGNRLDGARLASLVSFEALKLAASVYLLSPFVPLLFMGEEYGETAPFPYFVSHSDPSLVESVRRGRREGYRAFRWQGTPMDPQDEKTFLSAACSQTLRREGHHEILFAFYRELIRLRKSLPALEVLSKERTEVLGFEKEKVLFLRRWNGSQELLMLAHFGRDAAEIALPIPKGTWQKRLDTAEKRWQRRDTLEDAAPFPEVLVSEGESRIALSPYGFLLFERQ
ncbi:MAG: malto-oligosyltrehalose trehalohydrolase [Candidatus Omnitrophota bacterium]